MKNCRSLTGQGGLATVEMAIVGSLFFIILLGIIEVGRLMFSWNALNEVTRRGARLAAVCSVNDTEAVRNAAIFNGEVIAGLTPEDVIITYLDTAGAPVVDTNTNFGDIIFVRVSIADSFQYRLLIPFYYGWLNAPAFSTTVVAESLGVSPPGAGTPTC
ncbi:MAG: pilus assembly protein TadE [Moraxellaceae bacterium]|nr:MAG: pilus assembly protein TadE [Moraxellaceae bacterium]